MYQILVCDDDREIVDAIRLYLEAEGYRVRPAYDGEQALAILKNEDIKLVLLDIMMPKLDGISAVREIRKLSAVPVILISAKSEDADKILGLNIGADDYITKPVSAAGTCGAGEIKSPALHRARRDCTAECDHGRRACDRRRQKTGYSRRGAGETDSA